MELWIVESNIPAVVVGTVVGITPVVAVAVVPPMGEICNNNNNTFSHVKVYINCCRTAVKSLQTIK